MNENENENEKENNQMFPGMESIDLFNDNSNNVIYVDDMEEIPEYERLYDDYEIYTRDLENTFLDMFPVTKQATKYIQNIVQKRVKDVKMVKLVGDDNVKYKGNKIIYDIIEKDFRNYRIIPIVKDKLEMFAEILDEDYSEDDIYIRVTKRNPDSFIVTDQRLFLKKLDNIELEYENRKLSLSNYLQKKYDVLREYKIDYTKTGYKFETRMSFTALRYFDIDNKFWIDRKVDEPIYTTLEVRDESDSKITYMVEKKLVRGEEVNIVGFMILGIDQFSIMDLVYNESNFGRFSSLVNIEKITVGKKTKITVKNHNLTDDEIIYINNTNSKPELDGSFKITVLDKDNFIIDLDTYGGTDGDRGTIYARIKLSYQLNKITKENGNIKFKNEINKKMDVAKLYLFDTFKVEKKIWRKY